jgi:hypothetical protein
MFDAVAGGVVAAVTVARWSGRALDPAITAIFLDAPAELLRISGPDDLWAAVVDAEPVPRRMFRDEAAGKAAGFQSVLMASTRVAAASQPAAAARGPAPQTFDPDRFSPQRAEDKQPGKFIPHGGGPWQGHRCAGQGLAELMIQVYATLLLRDYTWELPSNDHALTSGELVPMPKDGLPVRFARYPG